MGLLEAQLEASLILEESETAFSSIARQMVDRYAKNALDAVDMYADLMNLIKTAKAAGRLKILHENSLKDGQPNTKKEG